MTPRELAALAIGFAVGTAVMLTWEQARGPRTYRECLVQESRGMPPNTFLLVHNLCADRFGDPTVASARP